MNERFCELLTGICAGRQVPGAGSVLISSSSELEEELDLWRFFGDRLVRTFRFFGLFGLLAGFSQISRVFSINEVSRLATFGLS